MEHKCTILYPHMTHKRNTEEHMPKQSVNARLSTETITLLEQWAAEHNTTRTGAIEELVRIGTEHANGESKTEPAPDPAPDLTELCELLRENNAELRTQVSNLWAQVAEKDRQIATAHELANHAQQLHMADVARALPPERQGLRARIARWIRGDDQEGKENEG